jgi:outer membrane protein insertion porin family
VWDDFSKSGLRFTPGVGLRVASPLGPIRLDIGYNRNQLQRGSVFTADEAGNLVQVGDNFRLDRGSRYTFHFSVGQAF